MSTCYGADVTFGFCETKQFSPIEQRANVGKDTLKCEHINELDLVSPCQPVSLADRKIPYLRNCGRKL